MSEASYTAWDDNLYEWPPPAGWYQASDGKWWPEGYGPPVSADVSTEILDERSSHDDHQNSRQEAGGRFDPGQTAMFPAGAPAGSDEHTDAGNGPPSNSAEERARAESQRPVYDELPPIDDVFGGVDPYATTPMGAESDAPAPSSREHDPGRDLDRDLSRGPADPVIDSAPPAGRPDDRPGRDHATHRDPETRPGPGVAGADQHMAESGAAFPGPPVQGPAPLSPEHGGAPSILENVSQGSGAPTREAEEHLPAAPSGGDRAPAGQGVAYEPAQGNMFGVTAPVQEAPRHDPPPNYGEAHLQAPSTYGRDEAPSPDAYSAPGRPLEPDSGGGGGRVLIVLGLATLAAVVGALVWFFVLRDGDAADGTSADDSTAQTTTGPGSFSEPYTFGTPVVVFYDGETEGEELRWVIEVLEPVADRSSDTPSADSPSGDDGGTTTTPPAEAEVSATTRVRVTFQSGPAPGQLSDLRLNSAGSSGTTFDLSTNACPSLSDGLDVGAALQPSESVEGDLCWQVPGGELGDLKLAVQAGPAEGTVFMQLR